MVLRSVDDWSVCSVQDLYECLHVYKQTLENHPFTSKHNIIYGLLRNVKWLFSNVYMDRVRFPDLQSAPCSHLKHF